MLGTIAYLAPIVLASWIAAWLGVVVFVILHRCGAWLCCGGATRPLPPAQAVDRAAVEDTRRILVVANETLGELQPPGAIVRLAEGVAEDVLVVCPLVHSQLQRTRPMRTVSVPPAGDTASLRRSTT